MENWIIVLLFVNGVIDSTGHRILDTVCITKNPSNNPFEGFCTYGSVVAGNDVNAERSYRRAARTRFLDYYPDYPILDNVSSCNISVIQNQRSSTSRFLTRFGFFKNINVNLPSSNFNSDVLVDEVKLGTGEQNNPERRNLTFGVFQCISSKHNYINTATVTITSHEAVFKPLVLTITANLDETVELVMTPSEGVHDIDVRWRYSWNSVTEEIVDWTGNISPVIDKVNTSNAGVYEAYTPSSNYSGYVRLIVRECPHNYWGPKPCRWTCPVCFNGGICDDISGECICPPGFYGKKCEQACEYGKIGQQCTMTCTQISENEDCSGLEICLPDPFGCTCAPGFTGLDCQTGCPEGKYGAGCTETCHCVGSCDSKNGMCEEGCESFWSGPMCQELIPVNNLTVVPSRGLDNISFTVSWQHTYTCADCDGLLPNISYDVHYQPTTTGFNESVIKVPGSETEVTIMNNKLYPCTEYSVSMTVRHVNGVESNRSLSISVITDSQDPEIRPQNVTVQQLPWGDGPPKLHVTWRADIDESSLKCDPDNTSYTYQVYYRTENNQDEMMMSTRGKETSLELSDLLPCTNYLMSVSVKNAVDRESNRSEPISVWTDSESM